MRLIDADALDMAFTNLRFNQDMSLAHWGDRKDWCLHGHEVEKLINDAPTIGGWISVKDRLPEVNAYDCLVYSETVEPAVYFKEEEGIWYTQDCYESEEIRGVLYWMPYPEPPEE